MIIACVHCLHTMVVCVLVYFIFCRVWNEFGFWGVFYIFVFWEMEHLERKKIVFDYFLQSLDYVMDNYFDVVIHQIRDLVHKNLWNMKAYFKMWDLWTFKGSFDNQMLLVCGRRIQLIVWLGLLVTKMLWKCLI